MTDNYNFFLKSDLKDFVGEWVAIANRKIVARGKDAKKTYNEAKAKHPKAKILISKVPDKTCIF